MRAFIKLDEDGEGHEEAEAERDEGVEVPYAGGEERDHQHQRGDAGPLEVAAEAIGGSLAPGEEGADAGEEKQEEADGDHQAVVPIGVERDLVAADGFGDDGEQGAPENREAARQQDEVVEQEAGLAGDDAFELRLAFEVIQAVEDEINGGGDADGHEGDEILSDFGAGEGVYRLHHAGAGEEGAQDAEEESGGDQNDVPDFHHAFLFLHHDGVEEGGARSEEHTSELQSLRH